MQVTCPSVLNLAWGVIMRKAAQMDPPQVGSISPVPETNLTPAHLWLNEDSWRVDMEGWGWGRHTAIRLLALVYSREGGI